MRPTDPDPLLSLEALGILDQLVDIANNEGRPEEAGIEWFTPDEEPPLDVLEELHRAGIARYHQENQSVVVHLTAEGIRRYV